MYNQAPMFFFAVLYRNIWGEYKVRVSHIQYCHLPDYEHQIISIVLSHCHYSLCHGEGQTVTYDLPALEKHFVDRFVHGKPFIKFEIQRFAYRKDAYSITTIRKRVRPQVCENLGISMFMNFKIILSHALG